MPTVEQELLAICVADGRRPRWREHGGAVASAPTATLAGERSSRIAQFAEPALVNASEPSRGSDRKQDRAKKRPQATRSDLRSSNEPPGGVEPPTYALRVRRSDRLS